IGLGVSNDGKTILAGTERNELWTLGPKAEQCAVLSSNNNVPWTAIALHGDGRYAVAAVNNSFTYWEISPNRRDLDADAWPEVIGGLAFLPDKQRILAAVGNTLRLWAPQQHEQRKLIHAREIVSLALSSDGKQLVSSSGDGSSYLWNFPLNKEPT